MHKHRNEEHREKQGLDEDIISASENAPQPA
jgi:hypothetical protein